MPLITGVITRDGATIDLIVERPAPVRAGVKSLRPPATPLIIRATLDTGSALTGVANRLLHSLGLDVVDSIMVGTPIGPPLMADRYSVKLSFVSGGTKVEFGELPVISTDCFKPDGEVQALIGRDILNHCAFEYWGTSKSFQFAF